MQTNQIIEATFNSTLAEIIAALKQNQDKVISQNSRIALNAFLNSAANLQNITSTIHSKLGNKPPRAFNQALFDRFIYLASIFEENKAENFKIIQDELINYPLIDNDNAPSISILSEVQNIQQLNNELWENTRLLNSGKIKKSPEILHKQITKNERFLKAIIEAEEDTQASLTANVINGYKTDIFYFQAMVYHDLYRIQDEEMRKDADLQFYKLASTTLQQQIIQKITKKIDFLKVSYMGYRSSFDHANQMDAFAIHDRSLQSKKRVGLTYDLIIQEYTALINLTPANSNHKRIKQQFIDDHHHFIKKIDTDNKHHRASNRYGKADLITINQLADSFQLKEAFEQALLRINIAYGVDNASDYQHFFNQTKAYGVVTGAFITENFNTIDNFLKITSLQLLSLKNFYKSFIELIKVLHHHPSFRKKILNLGELDLITTSLIILINHEKLYNAHSSGKSALEIKLGYMNIRDFLSILADLINNCIDFGAIIFNDSENIYVKKYYETHSLENNGDLKLLYELVQIDLSFAQQKLNYKDPTYSKITPEKIAHANKIYQDLCDECANNAKITEAKYANSIVEIKTENLKENKIRPSKAPRTTLTLFTPVQPKIPEEELYFKASKTEILAKEPFDKQKSTDYPLAVKNYTTQVQLAIVDYSLAKRVAEKSGNHRFVIASIQEIASCYLQLAIIQPALNMATSLAMYKKASGHAKDALAYFEANIKTLENDSQHPKIEDLFKGIYMVMDSITKGIAASEKYLKHQQAILTADLDQETILIRKIINDIGSQNWYVNKPKEQRSHYAELRKNKIQTLTDSNEHLNTLTDLIHKDATINTSIFYKTLFNDQSSSPLQHLMNPKEEKCLSALKAAAVDDTSTPISFSDKFARIKSAEKQFLMLGYSAAEEKHLTTPLLKP